MIRPVVGAARGWGGMRWYVCVVVDGVTGRGEDGSGGNQVAGDSDSVGA